MRRLVLIFAMLMALVGLMSACRNASEPPGAMQLIVDGLPAGVSADVRVSGPNDFSQQSSADVLLSDLVPGPYRVTAESASAGDDTFVPEPSSQTVTVKAGETASAQIAYVSRLLTTGRLEIVIDGLPNGAGAPVTLSGPQGFLRAVAESVTLDGLTPGTYAVTALEAEVGGETFIPEPSDQFVSVSVGASASASVTYRQGFASGQMEVVIVGLPVGAEAAVTVGNSAGFNRSVSSNATLDGLAPGEYVIGAEALSAGPYTFAPAQATQVATVAAGGLVRVTIRYDAVTSAVTLIISGLPSGAEAAVDFELADTPATAPALVVESTTFTDLPPGVYQYSATAVSFDGFRLEPDEASGTLRAEAGETVTAFIAYGPVDGKLLVTEEGLPGDTPVVIAKIAGPGLESGAQIATGSFLEGLEPGSYTVSERLASIVIDDVTYEVVNVPVILEVQAGEITVVAARFIAQQGDLKVEIGGLPTGFDANVVVTGSNGFNVEIKRTTTLFALEPGNYTISASDVPDDGRDYQPSPSEQIATVQKARTVAATVTYAKPPVVCCSQ